MLIECCLKMSAHFVIPIKNFVPSLSKKEVKGIKSYVKVFLHQFDYPKVKDNFTRIHLYALTVGDSTWIEYRENQVRRLMTFILDPRFPYNISENYSSFEDFKTEIRMMYLYKKELIEMLPKMKMEYNRRILIQEINDEEAFPSL